MECICCSTTNAASPDVTTRTNLIGRICRGVCSSFMTAPNVAHTSEVINPDDSHNYVGILPSTTLPEEDNTEERHQSDNEFDHNAPSFALGDPTSFPLNQDLQDQVSLAGKSSVEVLNSGSNFSIRVETHVFVNDKLVSALPWTSQPHVLQTTSRTDGKQYFRIRQRPTELDIQLFDGAGVCVESNSVQVGDLLYQEELQPGVIAERVEEQELDQPEHGYCNSFEESERSLVMSAGGSSLNVWTAAESLPKSPDLGDLPDSRPYWLITVTPPKQEDIFDGDTRSEAYLIPIHDQSPDWSVSAPHLEQLQISKKPILDIERQARETIPLFPPVRDFDLKSECDEKFNVPKAEALVQSASFVTVSLPLTPLDSRIAALCGIPSHEDNLSVAKARTDPKGQIKSTLRMHMARRYHNLAGKVQVQNRREVDNSSGWEGSSIPEEIPPQFRRSYHTKPLQSAPLQKCIGDWALMEPLDVLNFSSLDVSAPSPAAWRWIEEVEKMIEEEHTHRMWMISTRGTGIGSSNLLMPPADGGCPSFPPHHYSEAIIILEGAIHRTGARYNVLARGANDIFTHAFSGDISKRLKRTNYGNHKLAAKEDEVLASIIADHTHWMLPGRRVWIISRRLPTSEEGCPAFPRPLRDNGGRSSWRCRRRLTTLPEFIDEVNMEYNLKLTLKRAPNLPAALTGWRIWADSS